MGDATEGPATRAGRVRAALRSLRARFPLRRVLRWSLLAGVLGLLAVGYEASFRARLAAPHTRLPTALYTRPADWAASAERDPVVIAPLQRDIAEYRVPYRLEHVSDRLVQAVLAVEDQRFYSHHGLDLRRIAGAALANLKSGSIRQGGSTITQQLAKNLYLSSRRTPLRKLREAAMALALEDRYDKATILEAYLNEIYLGQDGGDPIHGVGAAARYYFGKSAGELTLGEAALLAGMIRAPNRYAPTRNAKAARERRDLVLRLMIEQERTTEKAATRARRERIATRARPRAEVAAPWFRDFVLARLKEEHGGKAPPARGAAVVTTLDAGLQQAANRAVRQGLDRLGVKGAQAALVALDPRRGEVLALVGGREYGASQFNRAVQARRQPGSAFKPVVALAALGRSGPGQPRFTLASVVEDTPLRVNTAAGPWVPANYDGAFRGPVTFREAMEQSLNVPFARIGLAVGPARIAATGRRLGIVSPLQPVPSLALGASEVTPLELTQAYGVLAAGGYRAELTTLLGVVDRDGAWQTTPARPGEQVADAAEIYLVTSALEGVIARGTGRGLSELGGWGGLAGKSGTSNDWRDAWFLAYTSSLVVGVWVGHDDGTSLGFSGARAALPIVAGFLREALRGRDPEPFPMPDGVEVAWTTDGNDGWGGWFCDGRQEVFLSGTAPETRCEAFPSGDRWSRGIEVRADVLAELLDEGGEQLLRRLAERLAELGRRGWQER